MGKGDGTCSERPGTDISAMELSREERRVLLHGSEVRAVLADALADRRWRSKDKRISDGADVYQRAVDQTIQALPYDVQHKLAVIYAREAAWVAPYEPTKGKAQVCLTSGEQLEAGVCPVHGAEAGCSEERTVEVAPAKQLPEELRDEYGRRASERDEAKAALVFYNQRWIIKEAYNNRLFKGRGVDTEELIQAGNEGMLEGVEQFEPERGLTFLTFAKNKVFMRMNRFCENEASRRRGIRPPSDVENEIMEVSAVLTQLRGRSHRDPTMEELHTAVNKRRAERGRKNEIKLERVEAAYSIHVAPPTSMQAQLRSDDGDSLEFGATLESQMHTDGLAENRELGQMLREAFDSMQDEERAVMEAYLGIATGEEMKTKQVVDHIGLKTNRVLELQQQGEATIHKTLARHGHNKGTLMSLMAS